MNEQRSDPGIENEPHLRAGSWQQDSSELSASSTLAHENSHASDIDRVEHTVWDEPGLEEKRRAASSSNDPTYQHWLRYNIERTSWLDSWSVTFLIALAAGPWGIIGALGSHFSSDGLTGFAVLAVVVFGPVAEEITKVGAALWVVEKRPFCFRSGGQIILCAACGGLTFAVLENLIYMHLYVPNHTPAFAAFRWTVCVVLHLVCSTLAGMGLERIWQDAVTNLRRPELSLGTRWFVAAMVCHGLYNLTVSIAESAGWLNFGIPPAG